ncbi:MAG: CDP-glycerol glycerophosphotransferase family protein [Oscillospiraceae bacterium]|nr:CDP-glycerol glycerophosphotransferase family protein [Oscillospiraceae bacterium]
MDTKDLIKIIYHNVRNTYKYLMHPAKKRRNPKINIIFLVVRTNVWNSVKSIYDAAKRNDKINTYVVALQSYHNGEIDSEDSSVYEFCKTIDSNTIKAYNPETKTYYDLEELKPDYIFLNVPYDEEYPEPYKSERLSRIAKLCYASYGYTIKKSKLQKITVRPSIMRYVSFIFACNNIMYGYYRKRMILTELVSGKRLYNIGFPRFDIYKNLAYKESEYKTIMWLPRWTTESQVAQGNEPSSFFKLKDKILDYIDNNPKCELIVRPHPKAFENYIKNNMMTETEVTAYKERIEAADNVSYDTNPSYYENLIKSDILIADFTSILAEYFVTGRPIIYFGNGDNYPPEHRGMYESFYHVDSWEMAKGILNDLINGIDYKKEQREQAVSDFMKDKPHNVGEHIINILVNKYKKE